MKVGHGTKITGKTGNLALLLTIYCTASYKRQNTENTEYTESGAIFYNLLRTLQIILG